MLTHRPECCNITTMASKYTTIKIWHKTRLALKKLAAKEDRSMVAVLHDLVCGKGMK